MQATLHLIKGNPQGKQVEVPAGTLTVGRAEDSDLIIASTRVSRHHCEIVNDQNRLVIRDKGSGNGTLINGAKVQEQVLTAGDEVQIGPLTFVVEIDGRRERSGGAPAAAGPRAAAQSKAAQAPPRAKSAPPKPAPPKPAAAAGGKRGPENDILASLERLAGGKKKPGEGSQKKSDDVLEISDEDLLDTDK